MMLNNNIQLLLKLHDHWNSYSQNGDAEEWDALFSNPPQGTIFHNWTGWKLPKAYSNEVVPTCRHTRQRSCRCYTVVFSKKGTYQNWYFLPASCSSFLSRAWLVGYDSLKQEKREKNYIEFKILFENFIKSNLKANYISISLSTDLQTRVFYMVRIYSGTSLRLCNRFSVKG